MNGLHNLSGLNRINDTSFFDILLKYSGIIRSLPSAEPITGYNIEKDKIENYVMDSIQARIHPLVELSYPFSEKIAFEFTGHFTRHEMGTSFAALYRYNYSTELSESVVYFFVSCNFDS
ncbi:MAG TPA: hypothetical protein ENN05_11715 [Deltaproteobacteria bacterium]|nr:hypothetical protein [Deltaproteobacteria bacterium]